MRDVEKNQAPILRIPFHLTQSFLDELLYRTVKISSGFLILNPISEEVFRKTNSNLQNALFHADLNHFHAFCIKLGGQFGSAK